jgi:ribosomal-protein-alanine N-acetyltransferase
MSESSPLQITLRPLRRSDLHQIVLLEIEIFPDPWPMAAFEEELDRENRGIIVAEYEQRIIGYAGYFFAAGEAQLTNIGVALEFRGKSVAKSLLNCILEIARKAGCENIFLDVRPSNKAAINLYIKFGFMELYRRPNYYRIPPEDALVMVKNLREETS